MIHPSGIQAPRDLKLNIKEVKTGLYVIENAYEGDAKYFPVNADEEIDDSAKANDNTGKTIKDSKD